MDKVIKYLMHHEIKVILSTLCEKGVNDAPFQDTTDCKIEVITKEGKEKSKIIGLDYVQTDEKLIEHIEDLIIKK